MNDEIKEILDRIETASEIFDCLLKPEECTRLLDYITNLQQDTEMYAQLKDEYEEEINDLQQENETLKEEKDNLYLDNTMLKMEKDIYKQGYEDFKKLIDTLQNGSDSQ